MPDIRYEIKEYIAILSDRDNNSWKKELNKVSWSGRDAKYDIREWNTDHSSCHKGITLSKEEVQALRDALNSLDL